MQKAKKNNAAHLMHGVAGLLRQANKSSNVFVHSKVWPKSQSQKLILSFVVSEQKKNMMDH